MQDRLSFNGVEIKQPDKDGYTVKLETTSTASSGRDMSLYMRQTPLGTVHAYDLKWTDIDAKEASKILKEVLNKASFTAHYFDAIEGKWMDGLFYATTFNTPCKTFKDGIEGWDELSFQMTAVEASKINL